jgi:uncharacterized membrane protein YeaQ/YmgE (transglycosylase-associated protein family)
MPIPALVSWAIAGVIAGVFARIVFPGSDPGGFVITAVLGAVGAMIGGFIAELLDLGGTDASPGRPGFYARLGCALAGALVILLVYRFIAGRRA